ncbi:MAG: zinc ribbon domain-containing protein [Acidobacteria bacterium]|nr:zinc ribbon domain-containing protein [Acidobacteriota bacterium]
MPIYEYVCQECQNQFEKIILKKSEPIECPKCGSERNTMRFSVVNTSVKSGDNGCPMPMGGGGCCGPGGCGFG